MFNKKRYVYIFLDPRRPGKFEYGDLCFLFEPFYVGKGTGYRYRENVLRPKNPIIKSKVKKIHEELGIEPYVIMPHKELSNQQALNLESSLITEIGRIDQEEGPLANFTDGGEGYSGNLGREWTPEQRRKIMAIRSIKQPREGMKNSASMRKKQSLAKKGKKFTKEHKENLSKKKSRPVIVTKEDGVFVGEYINTKTACEILGLSWSTVYPKLRKGIPHMGYFFKLK